MSKQLALSSALSVVMMAAVALFAASNTSRPAAAVSGESAGLTLPGAQALVR